MGSRNGNRAEDARPRLRFCILLHNPETRQLAIAESLHFSTSLARGRPALQTEVSSCKFKLNIWFGAFRTALATAS